MPISQVRLCILPRVIKKPSRSRCPDPEGAAGQHYQYPQHHKEKSFVGEWTHQNSKNETRAFIRVVLWCSSTASCWMMERLARPEANPSATVFVAAIWVYTTATGTIYFIHSDSQGIDLWLVCGGFCGLVCGWVVGWTLVEIMFRVLPGFILFAFWLGVHWA